MTAIPHSTEHSVDVAAAPGTVFDIIADVTRWPHFFGPTVHAEVVERTEPDADGVRTEVIKLWATANGAVKHWTSRRTLDAANHRVTFAQQVSQHPIAAMSGAWLAEPLAGGGSRVVLTHEFRAIGDAPENVDWITSAIDRNSEAELTALKVAAEVVGNRPELVFSFTDTVSIDGPRSAVYDFLYQAALWPERVPHVTRLEMAEDVPNLQAMEMDTRTPAGDVHTTKSIRVCFPESLIVYKQTKVPALMTAHTGYWQLTEREDGGVDATSQHLVVLNPDTITTVLGEGATVSTATEFIRSALSKNSTTTLRYAKEFAETAARSVAVAD
ncbi:aromatase/cyclase [Kitasatospora sp. NBC_01302]|uniref:aromatase/cyclase n=1 Tax=Kitasatospora sp. NBC_01302 TaxID=2903575 RepID=UPI002E1306B6|nr:aromatase/cyclase [Kitasatospora sp. NBC_01302]